MPFSEVYTGLETRTIDAEEHPINVVWSAKFYGTEATSPSSITPIRLCCCGDQ